MSLDGEVQMKRIAAIVVLAFLTGASGAAQAQSRGFGLGVIVGEPTGLSAKLWQSRSTALDFGAAWSFVDDSAFHLHVDILVHRFDVIQVDSGKLPLYYGVGGRAKFSKNDRGNQDAHVGIRFPVGLDYLFAREPLDLFFEIVPILDIAPETDVSLNASLGFRYWFR
jgi:hypothetical protein